MILTALDTINDIVFHKMDRCINDVFYLNTPQFKYIPSSIGAISKWEPEEISSEKSLTTKSLEETKNDK